MIAVSLFVIVTVISFTHGRAVDTRRAPLTVDSYGKRVFLVREQRNPMAIYPHRSMMISGIYQPKTRVSSRQATGVFAQGNAVSSDAFLAANVPKYAPEVPEAVDEPGISSAEAQAAPGPFETPVDEKEVNSGVENNEDETQDQKNVQTQQEEEVPQYSTAAPEVELPVVPQKGVEQRPGKSKKPSNKGKKSKVHAGNDDVDEADYEENDDDEDADEEQPTIFNPFEGNRRGAMPTFYNSFPMVFSFPKSHGRDSSSGSSLPGMITAIANSYSTGKSGVASSVATAYGGSPNSRKKLQKSHQE